MSLRGRVAERLFGDVIEDRVRAAVKELESDAERVGDG